MRVNKRAMLAVRLIRRGFRFGVTIRDEMERHGLSMRPVAFYGMMASIEDRGIVRGFNEPMDNGCKLRCYRSTSS